MIDGNISMEEDTELRDLVVQTLENNGVLAKLRAELRASVFLALEEQETVMNPEPLLNKMVKQYLSNEDGKLLFSLVREFLEYFGLDYTISVYDSETYFGKEYDYPGRNKLSEKLGVSTNEPLLGEILKSSISGAFNNSQKSQSGIGESRLNKTIETSTNFSNSTFEVSVPKVIHNKESESFSNDNDSSDKGESISETSPDLPINVTITDKKKSTNSLVDTSTCETHKKPTLRDNNEGFENKIEADVSDGAGNNNLPTSKLSPSPNNQNVTSNSRKQETKAVNDTNMINTSEQLIKFDESIGCEKVINQNDEVESKRRNADLRITNNAQNMKVIDSENNFEKTVYFEEIIVDGKRQKVGSARKNESLLGELPPITSKANSIFADLPSLNGKKTNINDLKELMDIGLGGDGGDNYEEDFVSSASGSANEHSPIKESDVESPDRSASTLSKKAKEEKSSGRNDEISEEIDEIEELDDASGENGISNFAMGITADYNDVV